MAPKESYLLLSISLYWPISILLLSYVTCKCDTSRSLLRFWHWGLIFLQCCPETSMTWSSPERSPGKKPGGGRGPAIPFSQAKCHRWLTCQLNVIEWASLGGSSRNYGNEWTLTVFVLFCLIFLQWQSNSGILFIIHLLFTRLYLLNNYQVPDIILDAMNIHIN